MTDFADDFGADTSFDPSTSSGLRMSGDSASPPDDRPRFGRGWVPGDRDIGLPDDDLPPRPIVSEGGSEWWCPKAGGPCRKPVDDGGEAFVSHQGWDAGRKVRFLHHLSEKGDVRAACARVGMSRTSAYLLRRRDGAFAQGWQAALVLARQHAEEVLATRALDGVEEAVWFRGELMGMRRRYDTRLLLAHLARLDRLADDGVHVAGRFDEALALVAGEDAGAHLPDIDPCAESLDRAREAGEGVLAGGPDALPLPPARAAYILATAEPAFIEANGAWIDAAEAIDRAFEEEHGFPPDHPERGEGVPDPVYPPAPAYAPFHRKSAARWDGWQGHAFACVDAALGQERAEEDRGTPPVEYKSLAGPAVGFPSGLCKPCQPVGSSERRHGWTNEGRKRERNAEFAVIGGAGRRGHPPTPPTNRAGRPLF